MTEGAARSSAELLVLAYERGEARGGSVDWSELDVAYKQAKSEMGPAEVARLRALARASEIAVLEEGPEARVACLLCGDAEGRNPYDFVCEHHPDFVLCHCGLVFPLMRGTYDPGFPARGPSWSSGGEPGEPPQVLCPDCVLEERCEESCPFEPIPLENFLGLVEGSYQQKHVAAALRQALLTARWTDFAAALHAYTAWHGWRIMDPEGRVWFTLVQSWAYTENRVAVYHVRACGPRLRSGF